MEIVDDVAEKYGVKVERKELSDSASGYAIYHTAEIFVVGPQGELRKTFPYNIDGQSLLHQIKSLLNIEQS